MTAIKIGQLAEIERKNLEGNIASWLTARFSEVAILEVRAVRLNPDKVQVVLSDDTSSVDKMPREYSGCSIDYVLESDLLPGNARG